MPKTNLLYRLENFLDQPKLKKLNLRFDQLDIFSFYQGKFLTVKSRKKGHVIITKTKNPNELRMRVMDQLIFSCALEFTKGKKSKMHNVPEPLGKGHIEMDADRFVLHYTMESQKKDQRLQFCFVYQQFQHDF